MKQLEVLIEKKDGIVSAKLVGSIDERADFSGIENLPNHKELHLDFSEVTHLNSLGILGWMKWLEKLHPTNDSLLFVFEHCPRIVIQQMNRVKGFVPENSEVRSLYVPYYNESSDETKNVLVKNGEHFTPPTKTSPLTINLPPVESEAGFEPDVVINKYFAFLSF